MTTPTAVDLFSTGTLQAAGRRERQGQRKHTMVRQGGAKGALRVNDSSYSSCSAILGFAVASHLPGTDMAGSHPPAGDDGVDGWEGHALPQPHGYPAAAGTARQRLNQHVMLHTLSNCQQAQHICSINMLAPALRTECR